MRISALALVSRWRVGGVQSERACWRRRCFPICPTRSLPRRSDVTVAKTASAAGGHDPRRATRCAWKSTTAGQAAWRSSTTATRGENFVLMTRDGQTIRDPRHGPIAVRQIRSDRLERRIRVHRDTHRRIARRRVKTARNGRATVEDGAAAHGVRHQDGIILRATEGERVGVGDNSVQRGPQDAALFTMPPRACRPWILGAMMGQGDGAAGANFNAQMCEALRNGGAPPDDELLRPAADRGASAAARRRLKRTVSHAWGSGLPCYCCDGAASPLCVAARRG